MESSKDYGETFEEGDVIGRGPESKSSRDVASLSAQEHVVFSSGLGP